MPDAGPAGYLLTHFWSVGPSMGEVAITNGELRDYQNNEGITLSPWECKTLRRLSSEYLNESHHATKPDRPPPYAESTDAERLLRLKQAEAARSLDDFLS